MVGHKLAEARFHPPYKSRRVGQNASPSAATADPPSAANEIEKLAVKSGPNIGGSQTR